MTDHKRPWWMLHWPSWLALALFSAAFLVLNVIAREDHRTSWLANDPVVAGWPLHIWRATGISLSSKPELWLWSCYSTTFGFLGRSFEWYPVRIGINFTCGVILISLSILCIERHCQRYNPRLTVRVVLTLLAIVAGVIAMVRPYWVDPIVYTLEAPSVVSIETVSLCLIGIAIGLASLSLVDFIGWLFRRKKAEE